MTHSPDSGRFRVLLFFIDGLGVGEDDPDVNPLATGAFPTLRLTRTSVPSPAVGSPALAYGIDARLGVAGLPQSATGQTTMLTGVNGSAALGRHASGFPGPTLRTILKEHSVLKQIVEGGLTATFLNAFGPHFFEAPETLRRLSATTLATLASGVPLRDWQALIEGRAVAHDLTHWSMIERGFDLTPRSAEEAGSIIARETMRVRFALFEYFETDRAGHDQDRKRAERCLSDLDRALEAVLLAVDRSETIVIVASDHGNLEDLRTKGHTLNEAFFAAWGPVGGLPKPESLTDLTPFILAALRKRG